MFSLREICGLMTPGAPASARALAEAHRWDGMAIGTGPDRVMEHLDAPALKYLAMDGDIPTVEEALARLDLVPRGKTLLPSVISLHEILSRHHADGSNRFRFLTYNTYLLKAKFVATWSEKPLLEPRARKLGRVIARDYDIACLYEIFTDDVWDWLTAAWPRPPSAARSPQGGDCACIVQKGQLRPGWTFRAFDSKGVVTDSDYHADKGILHSTIETDAGSIEIYCAHFFFGGGLVGDGSSPENRSKVKLDEARELLAFYRETHRPENVALIVGDFNMDGNANLRRRSQYQREYRQFRTLMEEAGFYDLWTWDMYRRPPDTGYTSRYSDDDVDPEFATCPIPGGDSVDDPARDMCDDSAVHQPHRNNISEGRLDHVWIQKPAPEHRCRLDTTRPARRTFKHRTHEDDETELYLSDHLGLSFDLIVSAKA